MMSSSFKHIQLNNETAEQNFALSQTEYISIVIKFICSARFTLTNTIFLHTNIDRYIFITKTNYMERTSINEESQK